MFNDVLDREQDFFDSRNKDKSKSPNFGYFRQNSPGFSRLEKKNKKKNSFSKLYKQSDKKVEKVRFFKRVGPWFNWSKKKFSMFLFKAK